MNIKRHGLRNTRLYTIWTNMKQRCANPNASGYEFYGARGISVCDEWKSDFLSFYNWAISNGYSDELTIDRINPKGNYEPCNCRWYTIQEQATNKRDDAKTRKGRLVNINGIEKTLLEWSEISGVDRNTIYRRIKSGLSGNDLIKPIEKSDKKSGIKGIVWHSKREVWQVRVYRNGKQSEIGQTKELADAVKILNDYLEGVSVN